MFKLCRDLQKSTYLRAPNEQILTLAEFSIKEALKNA